MDSGISDLWVYGWLPPIFHTGVEQGSPAPLRETCVESDLHHEYVGQLRNRVSHACHTCHAGGGVRNQNSQKVKP